jgi:hypothetical protein
VNVVVGRLRHQILGHEIIVIMGATRAHDLCRGSIAPGMVNPGILVILSANESTDGGG